ncbi:hypothetical protein niasHT_008725 [Heterodera trifolii]|uniref:Uncharacterized protein n=1 Tax=Heterodera trifolii TaxID=157864 RepID=A0ABD2M2B8_9BILA
MSHGAMLSLSNVTFVELGTFVRALTKRANRYNSARILHILTSKPVILAEPKLFEQYNSAFSERNRFGFNASQLLNYLYYRLLLEYRNFIPGQNGGDGMKNDGQQQNQVHEHSDELKGFKAIEMIRPIEGEEKRGTGRTDGEEGEGRGWIRRKMLHRYERKKPSVGKPTFRKTNRLPKLKNYGLLEEYCAVQTMEYLPNANGRVLVDRMMPGVKERTVFRNKFGKVVSAVVDGFKSMLEQLEWIQTADKRRAIQKADNIVRNIGYSELITDDRKLSFQLERLNWRNGPETPFFEMLEDIEQFRSANKWDALLKIGPADRQQFDASPAIANAWYMPQLNSITFPLAILQPPFFDSEWPDSINYGAIGVIIGHELSHAFDDEGIQWGAVGGLSDWMGNASMGAFRKMAECVVDEYGAFCPLNGTGMSPSCIDGSATQGENIADNGGIEAAFRAFRNSLSFYGPNPRLPGSLAAQFSDDQLFFLSFARIWCQRPMDDDENEMLATLLLDPHAPPKFRVLGTLRNFPAFRTAFNCPIGKKYAPSETEHCNVWVDEIKAVNGIPINEEELPPINVPKLGQSDNELFVRTAKLFSKSMDSKKDPCNDFYGYACANFEGPMHFERIQQQSVFYSLIALVDNFMDIPKTLPMRQSKEFFGKCLNDMANWRQLTKGSRVVIEHMAKFQRRKRMPFPLVDEAKGKETDYKWPTPDMLGSALGQLSTIYGIDTLLGSFVDTNWGDPHGVQPYFLFIDQGSLALPQKYYSDPIWARINKTYVDEVTHLLGRYVNALGVELNETEVRTVAEQIGQFEHTLANQLMAEGEKRNNFSRMYNPVTFMKMDDESLAWVDLQNYILEMLFTSASWEVFDRMLQQRNTIVVMEPEIMEKRSNAFRPGNPFGFVPAHLFNYLNFRLLLSLSPFFESDSPLGSQLFRSVSSERFIRPPIGRPRWDEPIFDLDEFFTAEEAAQSSEMNPFLALFGCVLSSLDLLPHHSSRLFLDLVLPKERDRQNLRKSVNEMVENVVVGFDSMLDQLEWMNEKSKKNAAEKVDNLVRNIAFPDWLVDDHKLAAYCERFPLNSEDNLIETQFRVSNFLLRESLELLTLKGPTNRTNFNGLPMMVNAWYQPELNSITLPLAILSPPFFHPNNPTALNYGILGAIVGHELTHAFDSVGTQFDAFGKLRQWMEPSSKAAFDAMVQCVIRQYGRFCPLPAQDGTANCVDGILSQRENVADNGGIRAAYRAYQNAMELRGAELALPGSLLSQYDHDQLFFLAFAQIWCQSAEDPAKTSRRLLLDPHPPPKFRVLGSLQNFPAFQNAFNCPKDSLYAPKEHCDVWISEVKQVNGDHFLPPPPSLNIPQKESELTPKFREASEYFEKSVDIAQDPCNNFYEYACNAFDEIAHFDRISIQNLITLATELRANNVHQQIEPIQKAKLAFEKCTFLMHHQNQVIVQADLPREKFFLFQKKSRLDFPVFAGQTMDWPSREELSKALGALSGSVMVDTLISFFVDTNWADPNSEEMPYALFVDQPTLAFDPYYYSPEVFPTVSHQMERIVDEILTEMANYLGVEYARKDLNAAVQEVIAFERLLANNFLVSDAIRENDLGSRFNLFTVSDAQLRFPFLNWSLFLRELAENAPQIVQEKLRQPNFRFAIAEPALLAKLGDELGPGNKHNLTANQLLNYLYFRMILFYSPYIPQAFTGKNATLNVPITQNWPKRAAKSGHIIKPISSRDYFFYRPSIGKPRRMEIFEEKKLQKINAQIDYSEFLCASYSLAMMDLVGGRLWLDQTMPNEESRHNLRKGAQRLVDSILLSFRSMVQQISWMSPRAKASAHAKLDKITANIGWPQTMVNNSKLEQYYQQLRFTDKDNFLIIWDKTMQFAYAQQWTHLLKRKGTDRTEFNGQIILTNAWYQPELNSITVPASILAQPFFDTEWPEAVIFGAIGVVLGHELSHGFDNHGVQWDAEGAANKWMDAHSQRAFDRMAKCVVDEYSQLCPFPPDGIVQPACIDGDKTQAENIADNGGLHAAFRAYRSALEVDGPSKALPGKLVGRFNHDQLFFLSFAQPWCEQPDDFETYLQLIGDSHSPAKFRVFGSLRNFPAFRNAFNCPLNSKYAPEKHCNVWVSPVTSSNTPAKSAQKTQPTKVRHLQMAFPLSLPRVFRCFFCVVLLLFGFSFVLPKPVELPIRIPFCPVFSRVIRRPDGEARKCLPHQLNLCLNALDDQSLIDARGVCCYHNQVDYFCCMDIPTRLCPSYRNVTVVIHNNFPQSPFPVRSFHFRKVSPIPLSLLPAFSSVSPPFPMSLPSSDHFGLPSSDPRPSTLWEALRHAVTNRRLIAMYGLTFALALTIPLFVTLVMRKWRERKHRRKLKEREEEEERMANETGGTFNKAILNSLRHFEMKEENLQKEKCQSERLQATVVDAENKQKDSEKEGEEATNALLEKEEGKRKRKARKKFKDTDPETAEGLKKLTEKGLHGKLATAQLRAKTQLLEEQMSDEDREKERKARQDQLEAIFKMMESQKEKFGINEKEELVEQLKMYSV